MKHIIDSEAVEKRKLFEQFATLHNMPVLKVGEAYSNDDTNYAWWVWQKALSSSPQADGRVLVPTEYRLDYSTGTPILMHKDCSVIEGKEAVAIFGLLSAYKPQSDDAYGQDFNLEYTCKRIRRLLNAMGMNDPSDGKDHVLMGMLFTLLGTICSKLEKPQADDVPPDVYDIVVDTGDGIYYTAEVVHFQQSGSKRMIQVRLGEPQADDVRKDAERYRWLRHGDNDELVIQRGPVEPTYHWLPRNERLDAMIDAHMKRQQEADQAIDKARE